MTLIKRGILQDYTQHSGDHLCALRRGKRLEGHRGGGGGAAIRDEESCGKDFKPRTTQTRKPSTRTTNSTGSRTEINRRYWCVNWSRPLDRQMTEEEEASPWICHLITNRVTTPATRPAVCLLNNGLSA